jgi:glycosyltransferase involved in cell wall biosynthesis
VKQKNKLPTIALCIIARDEEANIAACIDSARPFVDEVVVVDTGSKDRTQDIAREHGARVSEFAWCDDFAAARNAAIEAATSDWILMLDADEQLEPESGPLLRNTINAASAALHCYLPLIESVIRPDAADGYLASHHSRLFRRSADLRFVGTIHEDLRYLPAPLATNREQAPQIRIHHIGYIPDYYRARGKDERNRRLLERWRDRDPRDPVVYFHLGIQHSAMERHTDTIETLRRCVELCGTQRPWFLVDAYMRLFNALVVVGNATELDRIVPEADRANLISCKARELLSAHYRKRGRTDEAERHLLAALEPSCARGLTYYPGAGGWAARVALADLYEAIYRADLALPQLEMALADAELLNRGQTARSAARVALNLGDAAKAARWLSESRRHAAADFDTQVDLLKLRVSLAERADLDEVSPVERALIARDWQAAYDASRSAPLDDAFESASVIHVAERLHEQGASDAALDLLERVMEARSDWPKIYWLLMQVLAALGRYDDALAAADVIRQFEQPGALPAAA